MSKIVWSAEQLRSTIRSPIDEPLFFTSSGLGDDVVATPRRQLFEEMFDRPDADWPPRRMPFTGTCGRAANLPASG